MSELETALVMTARPVVVVSKSTRWMDPSRISTPVILVLGIQPNNEGCYRSGHTLLL
jgi:hypothetical protein